MKPTIIRHDEFVLYKSQLSSILNGIPVTDEIVKSMIDKPVLYCGEKIGTIETVSINEDIITLRLRPVKTIEDMYDVRSAISFA